MKSQAARPHPTIQTLHYYVTLALATKLLAKFWGSGEKVYSSQQPRTKTPSIIN